ESELYLSQVRPVEYRMLMEKGFRLLASGRPVVLDAPFMSELNDELWLRSVRDRTKALRAELHVVWVHADLEAMRERLIGRRATRDTYKLEHWDEWSRSVTAHPGPVRDVVPVYDVYNWGGHEAYLSNQIVQIG